MTMKYYGPRPPIAVASSRMDGVDGPINESRVIFSCEVGECCGMTTDYIKGEVTRFYRNADDTVRAETENLI